MTELSAVHRRLSPRAFNACIFATAVLLAPVSWPDSAHAQMPGYASMQQAFPQDETTQGAASDQPQAGQPEASEDAVLPDRLRRTVVNFDSSEPPGTVIIDTGHTALYYVLGQGRAIRYGVGVGREGFTWSGIETISRKAEWPDWHPPAEMIKRQPYLPRFMAGGPGNPLGARAIYLGASEYRIHGTNDPSTIGKFVSSGCIRMTNEDVTDLFGRVNVGTKVVVLPKNAPLMARGGDKGGDKAGEASRKPAALRPAVTTLPSRRQALNLSASSLD